MPTSTTITTTTPIRRLMDASLRLLGPWPVRPLLTFVMLFAALLFALNMNATTSAEPLIWAVLPAFPISLATAAVGGGALLLTRAGLRAVGAGPSLATFLLTMLVGGTALGVFAHVVRIGQPFELTSQWSDVLFLIARATVILFVIHAIAGVNDARLRAEVARAEDAVRTVSEQRRVFVDSEERARSAVARFLHDTVQGSLVAIALQLRAVRSETKDPTRAQLGSIIDALEEMRAVDVRSASRRLSPEIPVLGLERALLEAVDIYAGAMTVNVSIDADLFEWSHPTSGHDHQALATYRIVEQAVLNAAMHGRASTVWITITRADNDVVVTVDDDGSGPPPGPVPPGSGSAIIGAWTDVLRGSWELTGRPEGGARLRARFPITPALRR